MQETLHNCLCSAVIASLISCKFGTYLDVVSKALYIFVYTHTLNICYVCVSIHNKYL